MSDGCLALWVGVVAVVSGGVLALVWNVRRRRPVRIGPRWQRRRRPYWVGRIFGRWQ